MRQALRKTPSQPPPANPGWYTVSPTAPSIPITGAKGFQVSPGVDVGKAGSVRQAISAGNVVADAAQVLADIAGSGATMSPGAAMAGVTKVATALGMASVLLQKSTGVGTIRGKGMNGIGGAFAHRRAIASQDANRRRGEARANPYGNGSAGKRTSLADITAMVNDPSIVGLQMVSPAYKKGYAKVGALCPAPIFRPSTVSFAPRAARSCHCRRRRRYRRRRALSAPWPRAPRPQSVRCRPNFCNSFFNSKTVAHRCCSGQPNPTCPPSTTCPRTRAPPTVAGTNGCATPTRRSPTSSARSAGHTVL